ncbi:MAG: sugar transferase [Cyclobacteriaceae bacterium]
MYTAFIEKNPKNQTIVRNSNDSNTISSVFFNDSQILIKKYMDVLLSISLFLFVFSWLFPILSLAIKLTSKGPVFFKQLRHGKDNVPFICYKFRTMYNNDYADTKQATKDDPRITWIGKILRKTSMDELPQFFNVLKGDMSVVGPRPHAMPMNDKFSEEIQNFMYRHSVKPGITGLAQSKGFRGETRNYFDIYSRCKLDIFYINNWSPLLDFKIILWTLVSLIVNKEKAY